MNSTGPKLLFNECILATRILVGVWCAVHCIALSAVADEHVCHWAQSAIVVDGVADEEAWANAPVIDRFRIPGNPASIPNTATRARLLWDRQFLYFFAELDDVDLFADVTEHDGKTWNNDVFEMFFKQTPVASGYYEFQVNAAGTKTELFLPNRDGGGFDAFHASNDFHWTTKVRCHGTLNEREDRDQSWSVEGRIPWFDLMPTGGRPDIDEIWQFALCRYDYTRDREPELSSSAPLTQPSFHRCEEYSTLRFASTSETHEGMQALRHRPHFANSKVIGSPDPALPYRAVRAYPQLHLEWPVDVQVEPGSQRFLVIEEQGPYGPTKLMRTSEASQHTEMEMLVDTKGVAYNIVFHPKFLENGFFYVGSNGKTGSDPHKSRITRHALSRTAPFGLIGEPVTMIEWESNGHNGAAATFGNDGMMYVTSGDGTSDSDAKVTGQDLSQMLAKVMRIDVDHPSPEKHYSVPTDNPFVGLFNAVPETWAYGLRNPWRITTDRKTGHLWVGNNGQDMWEQVYLLERGANYGWSVFEGGHPFYSKRQLGPTQHVLPTVDHPHSEARSLTGGVVYYGSKLPELVGAYIYGDYSTGKIWAIKHDGKSILWHREIADTPFQISAISLDPEGELIVVDHRGDKQGGLYHLEPSSTQAHIKPDAESPDVHFPRLLSETGLFEQVAGHRVKKGLIPYSVNAPFWSDGALKSRFIALPTDGQIEIPDQWAWQFPDKTVIVKSFALESVVNDPAPKRWIETRLMVKQQGEWVGYSYAWNADQSDAELVDAAGRDQDFVLGDSSGERIQRWHYPSRTECMVCHTRAAGYLLGLTTVQMNREHEYELNEPERSVRSNQLEALEGMGILKTNWAAQAQESLRENLQAAGHSNEKIEKQLNQLVGSKGQRTVPNSRLLGKPGSEHRKLIDPYDSSADLAERARSFLHSNCAYCHIEAGGGNAKMNLSYYASLAQMNIIDVEPNHHSFEKSTAKLIAPGSPDRSVLLHRMGIRGPGQMPQLSTSQVDDKAVQMLKEWVLGMR